MFVVETLVDVIRIPPHLLLGAVSSASHNSKDGSSMSDVPTATAAAVVDDDAAIANATDQTRSNATNSAILHALHAEIDRKYPNRVLLDHGLVVSRYGGLQGVSHGVCVAGDGGSHHECRFRLLLFRPLVGEVCVGRIRRSTSEGVHVTLGFFDDVFIPAYWMLRPSTFDRKSGLWVWMPQYDDDEEEEGKEEAEKVEGTDQGTSPDKKKGERGTGAYGPDSAVDADADEAEVPGNRYEMEVGSEIRFKVKSIHFTRVTKTAKGLQATTTTTAGGNSGVGGGSGAGAGTSSAPSQSPPALTSLTPLRRERSSTIDSAASGGAAGSHQNHPQPPMYIVASICEDGLGLTSWWTNAEVEEEEELEGEELEEDPAEAEVDTN